VVGRLFVYLQMALRRKGALLFKAALLRRANHAVLITGFSGGGKTSLLLEMLADGWSFLSDDTCILADGVTYCFRPFIAANQYHLERFGQIRGAEAGADVFDSVRRSPMRRALRHLALKYVPHTLERSYKLQRLCDPRIRIDPRRIFPACEMIDAARPTVVWIVRPGERTGIRPIPMEDAWRRIDAIQHLTYPEFESVRHMLMVFNPNLRTPTSEELVRSNLRDLRAWEVTRRPAERDDRSFIANLTETLEPGDGAHGDGDGETTAGRAAPAVVDSKRSVDS